MTDAPLPAPLTPAECDLRGLPFMPLDVQRLRDSDLAGISSGDEFKAAVLLWCASWSQVPAASLPSDDRILAKLAGMDASTWAAAKEVALRGWMKCSDGRLYHPVVAEKAMDVLPRRQEAKAQRAGANERKARERAERKDLFAAARAKGLSPKWDTPMSELRALVGSACHAPVTRDIANQSQSEDRDLSRDQGCDSPAPVTGSVTAMTVTVIGTESPQPPLAGGDREKFDLAWSGLPDKVRGPANRDLSWDLWSGLIAAGETDADSLLAATRALSEAVAASGGKLPAKAFHRWLKLREWQNWATSGPAPSTVWPGPAHIRNAIIAHVAKVRCSRREAEEFAVSWLHATSWSDVPAAIVCLSSTVQKKLASTVGKMLADEFGVQVIVKSAGEAA